MKIFSRRHLAPLAVAALALASCDGGGGGGTGPENGRVAGSVTAGGAGVQGAAIVMTGGGNATTSASGQFAIENVAPGSRTLTLTVPDGFQLTAGQTAAKSVTVAAGQTATVAWQLTQTPPQTGRVEGSVTAGGTGVQGASIALTGGGTATTSAAGAFALENVAVGSRTLTLTVPNGYSLAAGQTAAKQVTVAAGQTVNVTWQLTQNPAPTVVEIHLTAGLRFSPAQVTIAPGTTVRWINDANMLHTITPLNASQPGAWPSQQLDNAGQTYEFTFTTAGTFEYRCNPHVGLGMTGTIVVQ